MTRVGRTSEFDPDLRRIATVLPRGVVGPRTLPLLRRLEARQRGRPRPGVEVESLGHLSLRVHRPPAGTPAPHPALLWIHGGGYVMGTAAQDDAVCGLVAARLGVLVAAVDHRLAPEHPFPTPLHDCHDALVWLAGRRDVDERRVAVGGASAGGGLAAALALLARDRGVVEAVFQLLTYPMLDDRTAARDDVEDRHARLWSNRSNRFGWSSYLATAPGAAGVSGLAAPARHEDLAGLPPAWIGVGSVDIFHDEDLGYAERLRGAGVPCEVTVVAGAFHGFDSVRPNAAVTRRFRDAQLGSLAAGLGLGPT
jgi:acetyl esterase/lipase